MRLWYWKSDPILYLELLERSLSELPYAIKQHSANANYWLKIAARDELADRYWIEPEYNLGRALKQEAEAKRKQALFNHYTREKLLTETQLIQQIMEEFLNDE